MQSLRLAIAYSVKDPAGKGAAEKILELLGGDEYNCPLAVVCYKLKTGTLLGGYSEDTINFEFLDKTPDPQADVIIVLSRHSATSGKPSLTTHHTGNPTSKVLGGAPYSLSWSAPAISKSLLVSYREEAERSGILDEYEVTLEATHHGPTNTRKPLVFIEIGSTPERWIDERAQYAMARAVIRTINQVRDCEPVVGFGEPHYPIKFTKLHLESKYCFGHILAKYALPDTTRDVVRQAIVKTWPYRPKKAFVQKKAAKSSIRKRIIEWIEEEGVNVEVI